MTWLKIFKWHIKRGMPVATHFDGSVYWYVMKNGNREAGLRNSPKYFKARFIYAALHNLRVTFYYKYLYRRMDTK